MTVQGIRDENGRVVAYEVPTFFLDRRTVRQIVRAVPGATLLAYRPHKDQLCEFKVGDVTFVVYELWGDSDRYWVGPKQAGWTRQPEVVRATFARARPFLFFAVV